MWDMASPTMILHSAHPRPSMPPEVQDIVSALMSAPLQITASSGTLQNSKVGHHSQVLFGASLAKTLSTFQVPASNHRPTVMQNYRKGSILECAGWIEWKFLTIGGSSVSPDNCPC